MATDNPRVAAYLQPANYELLKAFSQERGLSLSQGVDRIIAEYLGGSIPSQHTGNTPIKAEVVEGLEAFVEAVVMARSQLLIAQCQRDLGEQMQVLEANYLRELQYLKEELQILQQGSTLMTFQKHTAQSANNTPEYTSNTPTPGKVLVSNTPKYTADTPEDDELGLTQPQLARRLGINKSAVSRNKNKEGFGEWSKTRDPENVEWNYESNSERFYRVNNPT